MHLCIYLHIFSSIFNFYFYFQSGKAWFCTILSAFGVVILSVIAHLFNINHEGFVGSINQPEDGPAYVLNKKKSVIKRYEPLIEFNSYSCLLFFFYTNQLLYHFVSFCIILEIRRYLVKRLDIDNHSRFPTPPPVQQKCVLSPHTLISAVLFSMFTTPIYF